MSTEYERIAAKARENKTLRFTSLAHYITKQKLWEKLCQIPKSSSYGVDEMDVKEAKETFSQWHQDSIDSIHNKGYEAPSVRRVYIPKPGKAQRRPLGVPTIKDRAVQKVVSEILSQIYEQDFLPSSFGGRPGKSAHMALSKFHQNAVKGKVNWVYEADLKDFFGSLNHGWVMRFVEHRVGDPRILNLIRRWLKAGVMEEGEFKETSSGVPQGGPISVLLSNIYLHYVLDLWVEKVVKPRCKGEVYTIRYLDDFVLGFQHYEDALLFQKNLPKRLGRFDLSLEPSKTQLIAFGRYARERNNSKGKRKVEVCEFLGFTIYCTTSPTGLFKVSFKTQKSRLKRSMLKLKELLRRNRHGTLGYQQRQINLYLNGHYRYYGMFGNIPSLYRMFIYTRKYWRKALSSRSQRGRLTWDKYSKIVNLHPIQRPKIYISLNRIIEMALL